MRDQLGDLSVTIIELRAVAQPPYQVSRMATFSAWYEYGARFFQQVIAVGIAAAQVNRPLTPEELSPLASALEEAAFLEELLGQCSVAFEYIGYEQGSFYGGARWQQLCEWRSAGLFLAGLARAAGRALDLELSFAEEGMAAWAEELFEPLEAPAGMPTSHWWWFGASAPAAAP